MAGGGWEGLGADVWDGSDGGQMGGRIPPASQARCRLRSSQVSHGISGFDIIALWRQHMHDGQVRHSKPQTKESGEPRALLVLHILC